MYFKYNIKFFLWNIGFKCICVVESKCMVIYSIYIYELREYNDDVFIILILLKIVLYVYD